MREGGEEALKKGVDPAKAFADPVLIGTHKIDDWRYDNEVDGISTLLYYLRFQGNPDDIMANDDLAHVEWVPAASLNQYVVELEHQPLVVMVSDFFRSTLKVIR